MRYLRDTTLLTWVVLVTALVGVLWFAAAADDSTTTGTRTAGAAPVVVGATSSAAAATVTELRALAPYGVAAGSDSAALVSWATQMQTLAEEGHTVRAGEGAADSDPLAGTFTELTAATRTLAEVAADPVAAASARTRILMLTDRAMLLVSGQPVPDQLPATSLRPHGTPGTVEPTLPTTGVRPTPVAPLPGADHAHPTPSLPQTVKD